MRHAGLKIGGVVCALLVAGYFMIRGQVDAALRIPRPSFSPSPPYTEARSETVIQVPVHFPLSYLSDAVGTVESHSVIKDDWDQEREDERIILDRGTPSFACVPSGVSWTIPFTFTYGRRDCGGWPPRSAPVHWSVELSAPGTVSGSTTLSINPDFTAGCTTNLPVVKWNPERIIAKATVLTLIKFDKDVTDDANGRAGAILEQIRTKINDSVTSNVKPKPVITEAWSQLVKDIDAGDGAWLRINPVGLGSGEIAAVSPSEAALPLILRAKPIVFVGRRPLTVAPPTLPPKLEAVPTSGFWITCPVIVEYERVTQELRKSWVGKRLTYGPSGQWKINVDDVDVQGNSEWITIGLTVSGTINGRFDLQGRFRLEPIQKVLWLGDLTYTNETKEFLPKAFAWLFDVDLTSVLQHAARISFAKEVDDATRLANAALNRKVSEKIEIVGAVTRPLEVVAARSTAQGLDLLLTIEGQAAVHLR